MQGKTLVAVCAHADDAELNAGGTIAKWAAAGGKVAIVMVTGNTSGDFLPEDGDHTKLYKLEPEACAKVRHAEQEAAAAQVGATVHYLGYPQRHFWNGAQVQSLSFTQEHRGPEAVCGIPVLIAFRMQAEVQRLADLLLSLDPALVITQTMLDIDPEHHAVASMTFQAMLRTEALRAVPLYFWIAGSSAFQGMLDPGYDHVEDISDFYEKKLELCAAHRSQMIDSRWKMVQRHAEHWGRAIGVKYAEPFKRANVSMEEPAGLWADVRPLLSGGLRPATATS